MDETPAFFDMIPAKSICKAGSKECVVRTSSSEKKHITIVLSATADGKMLPPMIIFKGTTEKTIQKLRVLERFVIKTPEKLGFENSLLTFHAFLAQKIDEIQGKLMEKKTDVLMISSGCTSKYQPMDVCINKRFKAILQKCWMEDVSE